MSTITPIAELQRMTPEELRREIGMRRVEYAKMRLGIEMQKEKNHAAFKSRRKEIARMMTVLTSMKKMEKKEVKQATKKISSDSSGKASQTVKKPVKRSGAKSKKA